MKKQFTGSLEYKGIEYDYTAVIYTGSDAYAYPDQITDLNRLDREIIDEDIWEEVEAFALENAYLVEWCETEGWNEEDTGGGCSALTRAPTGIIQRITKADDPSVPQTMKDSIAVGFYNWNDELLGGCRIFQGGIEEWIELGGYEARKPFKEPKPVLKEGIIYSSDNGMLICKKCAGQSALYTGRDSSGQEVLAIPP
ncbi:MAG: hypothetical protein U9P12_01240 [Verrucomicrobiota bacterium]|nr:hypothetical protein [Verrucomicrobiota bacterium]